jgi:hypothetical protein
MGRMKDWMMDMEEHVCDSINFGAKTENDVVTYVKSNMAIVDESYVRRYYVEQQGPDDEEFILAR